MIITASDERENRRGGAGKTISSSESRISNQHKIERAQVSSKLHGSVRAYALMAFVLCLTACGLSLSSCTRAVEPRKPFAVMRTLAGAETSETSASFGETFGVAASLDGTVYVSDGEAGRIRGIAPDGASQTIAENLNTPSAIALERDGTHLVVADTGSHTIKRVELQTGRVTVIAGTENVSGFADGISDAARFNGPVGVAVAQDGTIFVADTYNDRIRAIDAEGRVRTVAGKDAPGYRDASSGADAQFDTPCGIAVDTDGSLVVADTGNHRLRRVVLDGAVSTIAGTGAQGVVDGPLLAASFNEPTGVAVDADGTIYVTDAGGSALRVCRRGLWRQVSTLVGYANAGLADGAPGVARLSRPVGVAVLPPDGTLLIADSGNRMVRAVLREGSARGVELTQNAIDALRTKASAFRGQAPPRWPYDPPDKPREIAATFGEIRGEIKAGEDAWFHNGLDVPGTYGETARAVRTEKILRPLAIEGVGGARERIRFPTLGYIHLRVGRSSDDRAFDDDRFVLRRDAAGKVTGVRVRRGAQFKAGDAVGTLNNQNHVHLIAGYAGAEFNALAALALPGVKDTVAPILEKDGVRLFDREGKEFDARSSDKSITVSGDVRIVARAYDQMDGNAARRRLGLYQLGYQVLKTDGSPAPGFAEPLVTISFENLPDEGRSTSLAYAAGSRSGATGETIFAYIVTNRVRDREAAEDYWHASQLPEGEYTLRVIASDFFGNRATRDIPVRIVR